MSAVLPRYKDFNHTLTVAMRDNLMAKGQYQKNAKGQGVAFLECHVCHKLFSAGTNNASYCGKTCEKRYERRIAGFWGKWHVKGCTVPKEYSVPLVAAQEPTNEEELAGLDEWLRRVA